MATYIVMEPSAEAWRKGEDTAIVRDGFHWLGFVLPVFWMLWYRLWMEAVVTFVATTLLAAAGRYFGFSGAASLLVLLIALYAGFEGAALRLAALRRRGWSEWGAIEASSLADAELRLGSEAEPAMETTTPEPRPDLPSPPSSGPARAAPVRGPALGLFAYPGRR